MAMKANELRLGNMVIEGRVIKIQELIAQVSQGEKNIVHALTGEE